MAGDHFTEEQLSIEVDRSRYHQNTNRGLAFKTVTAFGPNAAKFPYYGSKTEITDQNFLLIDSGGQYLDGTTRSV